MSYQLNITEFRFLDEEADGLPEQPSFDLEEFEHLLPADNAVVEEQMKDAKEKLDKAKEKPEEKYIIAKLSSDEPMDSSMIDLSSILTDFYLKTASDKEYSPYQSNYNFESDSEITLTFIVPEDSELSDYTLLVRES